MSVVQDESVTEVSDRISDTFNAWADHIATIDDADEKARQDTFYRELVYLTLVMEIDLDWGKALIDATRSDKLHEGLRTQINCFLNMYDRKYKSIGNPA